MDCGEDDVGDGGAVGEEWEEGDEGVVVEVGLVVNDEARLTGVGRGGEGGGLLCWRG